VAEALGTSRAGRPGLLIARDDPAALSLALRRWLTDTGLRQRLRQAARARRDQLPGWDETVHRVAGALSPALRKVVPR
jgi:glycosyltransferase involved in cell wall biosynthesis